MTLLPPHDLGHVIHGAPETELQQEDDPGHYLHAVETAVDDLRRFAWASQKGREGLAREGRRILEVQRTFYALAFFLSLYTPSEKPKDAA